MIQMPIDTPALVDHIIQVLEERFRRQQPCSPDDLDPLQAAGVLLLLSNRSGTQRRPGQLCLILTKRSHRVRQPGDLCCPGGSVSPHVDPLLSRFLSLPFGSLGRWKYWRQWKKHRYSLAQRLALFWATGLRESFEEMRLNPFGVRFLGPLPPHTLVMFQRAIFPLVGWIERQRRFFPNWEVEKIVAIPLEELLNHGNYAQYRLHLPSDGAFESTPTMGHYPCFRYQTSIGTELLWGATYRIVTEFLNFIFDFNPPEQQEIPTVTGILNSKYLTGHK
jgi:hypothetical protein